MKNTKKPKVIPGFTLLVSSHFMGSRCLVPLITSYVYIDSVLLCLVCVALYFLC